MNRSGKILLAATVICLMPGLLIEINVIEVSAVPGFYALLPAGLIFLAMFLLDLALAKEIARFDAEQRQRNHPIVARKQGAGDDEPLTHRQAPRPVPPE